MGKDISKWRRKRQIQLRRRMAIFAVCMGAAAALIFMAVFLNRKSEEQSDTESQEETEIVLTPECESYRSEVETVAKKHGMTEYVDLIMAVMMQESGGRSLDVIALFLHTYSLLSAYHYGVYVYIILLSVFCQVPFLVKQNKKSKHRSRFLP